MASFDGYFLARGKMDCGEVKYAASRQKNVATLDVKQIVDLKWVFKIGWNLQWLGCGSSEDYREEPTMETGGCPK